MSAQTTIYSGDLLVMDPSDERVIDMDWSALPDGVTINSQVFTISVLKQNGVTALTKDNESIDAGGRITQLRLLATTATLGDKYQVSNKITTTETPPQKIERSFFVRIENQ